LPPATASDYYQHGGTPENFTPDEIAAKGRYTAECEAAAIRKVGRQLSNLAGSPQWKYRTIKGINVPFKAPPHAAT